MEDRKTSMSQVVFRHAQVATVCTVFNVQKKMHATRKTDRNIEELDGERAAHSNR